jgi:hypothetical protein
MSTPPPAAEYVAARTALLDALEVLIEHRNALVVVGAQAVYLRTLGAGLVSAPYTDDGDLAIDVTRLAARPGLEDLMTAAKFRLKSIPRGGDRFQPGQWERDIVIDGRSFTPQVDLIVPLNTLAGRRDQRGARLPDHGPRAAMRTHGVEAAVVDNDPMLLGGLAADDTRSLSVNVAGAAALAVAKLHKISDRVADTGRPDRQTDKDAADLYRLIRVTPAGVMAERLHTLRDHPVAGGTVEEALLQLPELFGRPRSPGVAMAVRAVATDVAEATVTTQLTAYTRTLLERLERLQASP